MKEDKKEDKTDDKDKDKEKLDFTYLIQYALSTLPYFVEYLSGGGKVRVSLTYIGFDN